MCEACNHLWVLFSILSESKNKEREKKERESVATETIPLNRKIQQQKEVEMNLDSGLGGTRHYRLNIQSISFLLICFLSFWISLFEMF